MTIPKVVGFFEISPRPHHGNIQEVTTVPPEPLTMLGHTTDAIFWPGLTLQFLVFFDDLRGAWIDVSLENNDSD